MNSPTALCLGAASVLASLTIAPALAGAKPADTTVTAIQTSAHTAGTTLSVREVLRVGRTKVGSDRFTCLHFDHPIAMCSGVFTFAGGTVRVKGSIRLSRAHNTMTITGGTGSYAGAHGKLTLNGVSQTKTIESFRFA
jgi:hypothetical protein